MANPTGTDTHRYVGNHAAEINGVMREPGAFLKLNKEQLEDPHVEDMINSGVIVDLKSFTTVASEGGDK